MTLCEETSAEVAEVEADAAQAERGDLVVEGLRQACGTSLATLSLVMCGPALTSDGEFGGAVQGGGGVGPGEGHGQREHVGACTDLLPADDRSNPDDRPSLAGAHVRQESASDVEWSKNVGTVPVTESISA